MAQPQYPLTEEHRLTGDWFEPDSDRRARGTMSFHRGGFVLQTEGPSILPPVALEPGKPYSSFWEPAEFPVAWGTTLDGVDVTLFELSGHRFALPGESAGTELWRPSVGLIGAHVTSDVTFDRVIVRTEHLDEWAGTPGLPAELSQDEDGRAQRAAVTAERHTLESLDVDGYGHVEVESIPTASLAGREATVGLRSAFAITLEAPMGWRECFARVIALRDFCRLAIGAPTGIELLTLRLTGTTTTVHVLRRLAVAAQGAAKPVDSFDMLLRREDVPGTLSVGFARWLEIRERYFRAWSPLTFDDGKQAVDAGERFVQRSRAVEAFHAKDFGGSRAAVEERDARVAAALEQIADEGLRAWAEPLLEASSPPVARHRVMELVGTLGTAGTRLAGHDVDLFARYVVGTRNDLTHLETKSKTVLTDDEDIFWFGMSLEWIATTYLLRALGVAGEDINALIGRNARAIAAADHVAKFLAEARGAAS